MPCGGSMCNSRREFLSKTSLGLLAVAAALEAQEQKPSPPPGAPPAFGTATPVGPEVSATTFIEAEKLVQVEMNGAQRTQAADSWRTNMAPLYERRMGPHKVALETGLAPYTHGNPVLPGQKQGPERNLFVRSNADPGPLPSSDKEI